MTTHQLLIAPERMRGGSPVDPQPELSLYETPWGIQTELWTAFQKFNDEHPDIWKAFQDLAFQLIRAGVKHYSADGILHVIRYTMVTSNDKAKPFKINNNFSACYSRLWAMRHPRESGLFERRRSKADKERLV